MSKRMGIYIIYNVLSKKYYVGSSVDVDRRLSGHLNNLRKGTHDNAHLQRAFIKHGETCFVWGLAEEVKDREHLLSVEQEWIDLVGDYNICRVAGNTLGWTPTEETRARMSAAQKGENNPMFGVKRPEISALMSEVHKGRKLSDEHKAKMSAALKGKRGPWNDPDKAAKILEAARLGRLGKPHDEETRRKISEKIKGRKLSEEHKRKIAEKSSMQKHTLETRKKISEARKGKPINLSDEERQRRAEQVVKVTGQLTDEQKSNKAKKGRETRRAKLAGK